MTSLLLALQWGGNEKPWNDRDVIATLVVAGVLLISFAAWEMHMGTRAMVPLALLKRRTQVGAAAEAVSQLRIAPRHQFILFSVLCFPYAASRHLLRSG